MGLAAAAGLAELELAVIGAAFCEAYGARVPELVGEGTELFVEPVPKRLVGRRLDESEIGEKTGLNVIAVRQDGHSITNPPATSELPADGTLVMIGTSDQHRTFLERYESR